MSSEKFHLVEASLLLFSMYSFGCHVSNDLKVNSPKTTDISRCFVFVIVVGVRNSWIWCLISAIRSVVKMNPSKWSSTRWFSSWKMWIVLPRPSEPPPQRWTQLIDGAFELQKDTMGYHGMHTSIAISINIILYTYYHCCMWCSCHVSNPSSNFPGVGFFQIFGYNLTFCCGRACSIVSCPARRWSMLARVLPRRPPRRRAACWRRPAVWRRCRKTRRRIQPFPPMAPATAGEAPRRCTARRPRRWARTPPPWSATRRFRCRRCCGKYRGWRLKLLIPKRQKWWKRTKKKRKRKIVGRRHGIYMNLQASIWEIDVFAIAEINIK